jgi:hypothetical protein
MGDEVSDAEEHEQARSVSAGAAVATALAAARASFAPTAASDPRAQWVAHLKAALAAADIAASVSDASAATEVQHGRLHAVVTVGGESFGAAVP